MPGPCAVLLVDSRKSCYLNDHTYAHTPSYAAKLCRVGPDTLRPAGEGGWRLMVVCERLRRQLPARPAASCSLARPVGSPGGPVARLLGSLGSLARSGISPARLRDRRGPVGSHSRRAGHS